MIKRKQFVGALYLSHPKSDGRHLYWPPIGSPSISLGHFPADHHADLARSQMPAVIVQCRDDRIAPTAMGEYMHGVLPRGRAVR